LNDGEKHPGSRPPHAGAAGPRQAGRAGRGQPVAKKSGLLRKLALGISIAVGLILLGSGVLLGLGQYAVVALWPTAAAEVTKSQVLYQDGSYQPEAEFRYTVQGRDFVSKAVLAAGVSGYPQAKRLADGYSPGTGHAIRYSPRHPEQIIADAGYTLEFFRRPLLVVGLGGVILFLTWRFGVRTRPPARKLAPAQTWRLGGAFFAAMGILFFSIGSRQAYSDYRVVKAWLSADAQVASNRIRRYRKYSSRNTSRDVYSYEVIVEFRYAVDGKEFVSPSPEECNSPQDAQRVRALWAPGSRHEIRYNPGDPNDIRFDVNPASFSLATECIFPGMGLLFAGIGATILYVSRPKRAKAAVLPGLRGQSS
jgi:hypothetical protein